MPLDKITLHQVHSLSAFWHPAIFPPAQPIQRHSISTDKDKKSSTRTASRLRRPLTSLFYYSKILQSFCA